MKYSDQKMNSLKEGEGGPTFKLQWDPGPGS